MNSFIDSFMRRARAKWVRWTSPSVVSLVPSGVPKGRVLLSYLTAPFHRSFDPMNAFHSNLEECRVMADVFLSVGYRVDAVNYDDPSPPPEGPYDMVLDLHSRLGDCSRAYGPRALYVAYATGSHWIFQNAAEKKRLEDLSLRRGAGLKPRRQVGPMSSLAFADAVLMLGNAFTRRTYPNLDVPVHLMNVSSPEAPWDEAKDHAAVSKNFIWIGGRGAVHKGLDLVLEAFSEMPDCSLTLFADLAPETDFFKVYRRELGLPHVHRMGWVPVRSEVFRRTCHESAGLLFPSCSESQSAAVAAGLHQGLIPLLTPEAGYDVDPSWGVSLPSPSVPSIRSAVREVGSRSPETLRSMSRAAWEKARRDHTLDAFENRFRRIVEEELIPALDRKRRGRS